MAAKRRGSSDARLRAIQTTENQDLLIEALEDPSPVAVEAAARRVNQPRAAGALARAFLRLAEGAPASDPGCWARMAILEALGRLETPEADVAAFRAIRAVQVEAISYGKADTATGLRVAAAGLLANLRPWGALLDLAWLLFDFEPNAPCSRQERPFAKLATRTAAAKAIGALGDPAGAAVLALRLAFPGEELPEVLAECMDGLAALKESRALELLAPWLDSPDAYLAAAAGSAIATVAPAKAVPLLVKAVDRVVIDAREPLLYALAGIRNDEARRALEALIRHPDPRIRQVVAKITAPGSASS